MAPDELNGLPPAQTTEQQTRKHDLPSPEILRQYEEKLPGSGYKVLDEALAQRQHEREMERRVAERSASNGRKVWRSIYSIVLLSLVAATIAFTIYEQVVPSTAAQWIQTVLVWLDIATLLIGMIVEAIIWLNSRQT